MNFPDDMPLAEKLEMIRERADRDPVYRARLMAMITEEDIKASERVLWECLRDAPDPELRREAARGLVQFYAKDQKFRLQ